MNSATVVKKAFSLPLAICLAFVTGFFAGAISRAADLLHISLFGWPPHYGLMRFALQDLALASAFVIATIWATKRFVSSRMEIAAVIAAAIIGGWAGF